MPLPPLAYASCWCDVLILMLFPDLVNDRQSFNSYESMEFSLRREEKRRKASLVSSFYQDLYDAGSAADLLPPR